MTIIPRMWNCGHQIAGNLASFESADCCCVRIRLLAMVNLQQQNVAKHWVYLQWLLIHLPIAMLINACPIVLHIVEMVDVAMVAMCSLHVVALLS